MDEDAKITMNLLTSGWQPGANQALSIERSFGTLNRAFRFEVFTGQPRPSPGLKTPSLNSGTLTLGSGTPSLGWGTPSLGLGSPSLGLGTPSIGLRTASRGLGPQA